MATDGEPPERDYRVRRSELNRTVHDSEGFSVYDAIVAQIDWDDERPWLSLLRVLNESQRTVVALAQVHEHAQFNGIEASLKHHGSEALGIAAEGAARLGNESLHGLLLAALAPSPDWKTLEDRWDREAQFEIETFIEANATDFFLEEP